MKIAKMIGGAALVLAGTIFGAAQEPAQTVKPAQTAPALAEVKEEFEGDALDAKKWEQYSIEGGGKIKLEKGRLITSGAGGSRAGVRSVATFTGERFLVSAKVAKVSAGLSEASGTPTGNAILVVMFDNTGVNRLEWLFTTEGTFEAWLMRDGKSERLDTKSLATREKSPTLGIGRRGEDFFFMLNGEVGLQKKIKNLPTSFRVMLYGFGASKDEWDSVSVITPEQK
jgi:hypothetical protein